MEAGRFRKQAEEDNEEGRCKVLLLGDTGVGKTCLLLRMAKGEFKDEHVVTLGADFANILVTLEGKRLQVQIWDTCGLERYRSMARVFFTGAQAALLVFDVTQKNSFDSLLFWLESLQDCSSPNVKFYVVGNKCDKTPPIVSPAECQAFVNAHNLDGYFETSAKLGAGVDALLRHIAQQQLLQTHIEVLPTVTTLIPNPRTKPRCFC